MYVPASQNIPVPDPTCRLKASNRRLAQTQCQVNKGRNNLYLTTPSIASLTDVSNELAGQAQQILSQSDVARASVIGAGTPTVYSVQSQPGAVEQSAPTVVPMNPDSQTGSCVHKVVAKPPVAVAAPLPVMPKPAPTPTPQGLKAPPTPTNLCWALRNGAVDASQFAPGDLAKAMWACNQKGYVGACVPPVAITEYINANRGKLPMIPVNDAVLAAIPDAPPLQGVDCQQSLKLAGLAGVAPFWGDAGLWDVSTASPVSGDGGFLGWVRAHPWLSLGVAAGLVFVLSDERRGRGYGR